MPDQPAHTNAYVTPCPACAGDANWCECCPCCQQESGDCACDEIACGWDHLGRLRAENAALREAGQRLCELVQPNAGTNVHQRQVLAASDAWKLLEHAPDDMELLMREIDRLRAALAVRPHVQAVPAHPEKCICGLLWPCPQREALGHDVPFDSPSLNAPSQNPGSDAGHNGKASP